MKTMSTRVIGVACAFALVLTGVWQVANSAGVTKLGEWHEFGNFSTSEDFATGCTRSLGDIGTLTVSASATRKAEVTKPAADCSIHKGPFDVDNDDVLVATADVRLSSLTNRVEIRRPLEEQENQDGTVEAPLEGSFKARLKIAQWQEVGDEDDKDKALRECNTDVTTTSPTFVKIVSKPCEMVEKADYVKVAFRARRQDVREPALAPIYKTRGTIVYSTGYGVAKIDYLKLEKTSGN
jgi:hypothetical protein